MKGIVLLCGLAIGLILDDGVAGVLYALHGFLLLSIIRGPLFRGVLVFLGLYAIGAVFFLFPGSLFLADPSGIAWLLLGCLVGAFGLQNATPAILMASAGIWIPLGLPLLAVAVFLIGSFPPSPALFLLQEMAVGLAFVLALLSTAWAVQALPDINPSRVPMMLYPALGAAVVGFAWTGQGGLAILLVAALFSLVPPFVFSGIMVLVVIALFGLGGGWAASLVDPGAPSFTEASFSVGKAWFLLWLSAFVPLAGLLLVRLRFMGRAKRRLAVMLFIGTTLGVLFLPLQEPVFLLFCFAMGTALAPPIGSQKGLSGDLALSQSLNRFLWIRSLPSAPTQADPNSPNPSPPFLAEQQTKDAP